MNGISAFFELNFSDKKISKKISEICGEFLLEPYIENLGPIEYNSMTGDIYYKDLGGDELNKYIENGYMMVIRLYGLKEEKKELYEKWNEDFPNTCPPLEMFRSVYFPIKYDESLLFKCPNTYATGAHSRRSEIWHYISQEDMLEIVKGWKTNRFLTTCRIVIDYSKIELGIVPLIKVGNDRYIEYCDKQYLKINLDNKVATYWHGIQLKNAFIDSFIDIVGINLEKGVINIMNNEIIPNVARDNLANDDIEKITLAIKRAAYQYVISKLNDLELKTVLQDYMNSNYPADNPYCIN